MFGLLKSGHQREADMFTTAAIGHFRHIHTQFGEQVTGAITGVDMYGYRVTGTNIFLINIQLNKNSDGFQTHRYFY